jgi:arsenate reductase
LSCFLTSCLLILDLFLPYLRKMKVYGITNCNTVKKALDWLKANNVEYEFHDFKKLGISEEKLNEWDKKAGYEKFLNKQGLTWKQLDPKVKESIKTSNDALKLLQQKTSMIKRPVIENDGFLFFGFDEETYNKLIK